VASCDPPAATLTLIRRTTACSATTKDCGQFCIPLAQNCVSGIPARRALAPESNLCPSGLTACYLGNLASLAKGRSVSWECLDTQKDIESCGGCQYPQIAEEQGEDCTEMDGVDQVTVSRRVRLTCVSTADLLNRSATKANVKPSLVSEASN
jgi:hypothetical protein